MADSKITALTSIGASTDPANDPLVLVDVSDTSMAATGTTKKVTLNQLLGASGTATLASATITGDLTVDTNVLKVDSAGNRVSVNTTTFATDSAFAVKTTAGKFDVRAAGSLSIKLNSDQSMLYNVPTGNSHLFQINDSDAMTLNATGLGVGGSPSYKLSSIGTTNNQVVLHVGNTAGTVDGDTTNVVRFAAGSGANALWANARYDGFSHAWRCNSTTTEAMVLNSSGNVGIGVTPSAWTTSYNALNIGSGGSIAAYKSANYDQFYVGSNFFENTSGAWRFINNGYATQYWHNSGSHVWRISTTSNAAGANQPLTWTQAMTLDASGRLLVNNTSTGDNKLEVSGTNATNSYAAKFSGGSSTSNGVYFYLPGTRSSDTTYYLQRYGDDAAIRFQIFGNGNVQNTTGTYGTISDLRLKENISDARNYLADLLKLRVVKYSLKSDASPSANLLGLIAQEVEQVFPTLVETSGDDVKSVKTTVLIPMLLKALQELTARVQTLETR